MILVIVHDKFCLTLECDVAFATHYRFLVTISVIRHAEDPFYKIGEIIYKYFNAPFSIEVNN